VNFPLSRSLQKLLSIDCTIAHQILKQNRFDCHWSMCVWDELLITRASKFLRCVCPRVFQDPLVVPFVSLGPPLYSCIRYFFSYQSSHSHTPGILIPFLRFIVHCCVLAFLQGPTLLLWLVMSVYVTSSYWGFLSVDYFLYNVDPLLCDSHRRCHQ
jgi:hypothetical protein